MLCSMKYDPSLITPDAIYGEQKRLAKSGWAYIAIYLVINTVPYIYLDLYAYDEDRQYGLLGLVSWALGYVLFVGLMQRGGLLFAGKQTGIGTYFALCIAIGIPVVLALFVLILPGLYLLMRWSPAYSRALVTTEGIGNAMRWSWEMTEPLQKPLALAMIAPVSAYAVSMAMMVPYEFYSDSLGWTGFVTITVIANVALSVGVAWITIFGIASYGLVDESARRLENVFQ